MIRNQHITFAGFIAFSLVVIGCSDSEPIALTQSPPAVFAVPIEGGLIFDTVLKSNDVEMFPTFADMNSDGKPDLIVGTFRGVSVQLNQSQGEKVDFAAPYPAKPPTYDDGIPWG